MVHLTVEDCSEELLRNQSYSYAIKNQRGASKITPNGAILRSKAPSRGIWMFELGLYGIRLLVQASLGKLWTNESTVM